MTLLLDHFAGHARDLPWRRTLDPYAIWISEIMLQQTQVKTVVPYWERWMRELPTVPALARARPERVLKLWEGLGYYTRARNLQKAARLILEHHQGRFPDQFDEVLALPGIGRYTAGAICSIARNQPQPVVDGNVIRVLARLFGIAGNPRARRIREQLWTLATQLVATAARCAFRVQSSGMKISGPCSAMNQSLMEFGATVCTPRQPRCQVCPLRRLCVARRDGRVEELPNLGPQPASSVQQFIALVLEHHGRFLVRQRPAGGVNAHLWEFPNIEVDGNAENPREAARVLLGSPATGWYRLGTIKHSITRHRITVKVFRGELGKRPKRNRRTERWLRRAELDQLAFTRAHGRIRRQLAAD